MSGARVVLELSVQQFRGLSSPPRGSQRVGLVPLTWASTGIQDERVGLSNLDTGLACPPAIGSVLLLRLWVRIWSGTVSKKRVQNLKILLWSLTCSRPTWIQNMSKSAPNMVWNGLKKEGAKSEDFVVEPDLLTTNLGPKYDRIGSEYGPKRSQKRGCNI